MSNEKSKYVVADQNTYNNVGAVVKETSLSQNNIMSQFNNLAYNQQFNVFPTNITNIEEINFNQTQNIGQQTIQDIQSPQIPFNTIDSSQYQQIMDIPNLDPNQFNNIPTFPSVPPQDMNSNQPVFNEFVENQTQHVTADQLLGDYGLTNNIRVEDDSYNINIDDQISNGHDIYNYNQPIDNNNQEIFITHKNLNYNAAPDEKVHTNSFSKKRFIPPQIGNTKKTGNFEKKMRRKNRFINFLLFIVYMLIFGVVGYFGYNYYLDQQQFYFSRDNIKIVEGATFEESIYIKNKVQKNENYTFKSKDTNIVNVDKKGNITAIAPGKTTITVISKDERHTASIEVEVISSDIESFKLEHTEKKMYVDGIYEIEPIINGEKNIIINLEWQSSNDDILTVSSDGIVYAHNVGIAEVIVSIPNTKHKAKVLIQVKK